MKSKTSNMDFSLWIILNWYSRATWWVSWLWGEEIINLFIIDFKVTDVDYKFMLIMRSNFLKYLIDSSWNHTTVFKIRSRSIHCESLTCSSLTIAHNSSIVTRSNSFNNITCTVSKYIFLRRVVHNLVEFEFPGFLLIINETSIGIFRYMNCNMLNRKKFLRI